jgi:hypothetical protein
MYLFPIEQTPCPPLSHQRLSQYLGDSSEGIVQVASAPDSLFGGGTLGYVGMGLGIFGAISLLRALLGRS